MDDNNADKKGKLFVITGPSGSGKTTIIKDFLQQYKPCITNLYFSISHTTRQCRANEIDEVDYFFISKVEFAQKVVNHDFIEYAQFDQHSYGTSAAFITQSLGKGKNILLDIEMAGTKAIRELYPHDSYLIYISVAPSMIETRLRNRKSNSESSVNARMQQFINDYENIDTDQFDLVIMNREQRLTSVRKQLVTFFRQHGIKI